MQSPNQKQKIFIFCDGGGVKGLMTLQIIGQLEKDLGFNIFEKASLIGGTSTGGMITFFRMAGHSNEEIKRLYITLGREVFKHDCRNITESQSIANTKMFEQEITKLVGPTTLSQFKPHIKGFVMTSITNLVLPHRGPEPYILSNYHNPARSIEPKELHDHSVTFSIRATSAIPALFSTPTYKTFTFMDGGYFNNNPIHVGFQEAASLFGLEGMKNFIFLSFGCGYELKKEDIVSTMTSSFTGGTKFITTNLGKVIDNPITRITNFMTGSSHEEHLKFRKANPNLNYFRFDPIVGKSISITDVSEPSIAFMEEEATKFINSQEYKEMVGKLKSILTC